MRGLLALLVIGCGTPKPPATPVLSEQEICEHVADRVVDRFVAVASQQWAIDHPDLPVATRFEGDHHTMLVTVMFDSCFAEWPAPVRTCFLEGPTEASIDSCALPPALKAGALRRTATMLYSITSS
jgi:hypothetical protein